MLGRELIFGIAVVLLLGCGWGVWFAATGGDQPTFSPIGYNKIVKEWFERDLIEVSRVDGEPHLDVVEDQLSEIEKLWLSRSFLRDDIRRFNGGDKSIFVQETRDGQTTWRINQYQHAFDPFEFGAGGWSGRLVYRAPKRGATLWSTNRRVFLQEPAPAELPVPPARLAKLHLASESSDEDPSIIVGPGVNVTFFDKTRCAAEIFFLGNDPVLLVRDDEAGIHVNGRQVKAGDTNAVVLRNGDSLVFSKRSASSREVRQQFFYWEEHLVSGVISSIQRVNGRSKRQTTPTPAFGKHLARAIDRAARDKKASGQESFDVELTLDEPLHNNIEEILLEDRSHSGEGSRSAAAVAVMDIEDGELLALASYPPPNVARHISQDRSQQLMRNHNFRLHRVGSAGKVFLAAAALETKPELARLARRCHASTLNSTAVLDIALPDDRGFETLTPRVCGGEGGAPLWYGFEDYLAVSANQYAIDLFTLAMANWHPGPISSRWRIAPNVYVNGISHEWYQTDPMSMVRLEQLPVFRNLGRLFAVDVQLRQETDDEDTRNRYGLKIVAPILERVSVAPMVPDSFLSGHVTPERANFRANTNLLNLREDYVSFVLGGNTNEWSNV